MGVSLSLRDVARGMLFHFCATSFFLSPPSSDSPSKKISFSSWLREALAHYAEPSGFVLGHGHNFNPEYVYNQQKFAGSQINQLF